MPDFKKLNVKVKGTGRVNIDPRGADVAVRGNSELYASGNRCRRSTDVRPEKTQK